MRTPYIGVSGFMHADEVHAVLEVVPPTHTLMAGVLMSEKTLRGETNKYPNRYPKREDVAGIFVDDPRCLNMIHYASDTGPSSTEITMLDFWGGPLLGGFQFNGRWPRFEALTGASAQLVRRRVVLQFRDFGASQPPSTWDECLTRRMRTIGYMPYLTDVLLDASGGRGRPLDLDAASFAVAMLSERYHGLGVGVAGALDAEALGDPGLRALLQLRPWVSIDAEGKLRDEDDRLDIAKARAYVVGAVECGAGRRDES